MRIDEALQKLDALHAIADRAATFNGLRATPIALTGSLGIVAALIQSRFLAHASDPLLAFLTLWTGVAALALTIVLSDMLLRYYRDPTARARRMTLEVLTRLTPSLAVGAGLTLIVYFSATEIAWMLPGLWSLLLGLGIFAAARILPRCLGQVGFWYLGCGFAMLLMARGDLALSPLSMAIPFGGGQLLTAWLIHTSSSVTASGIDG